MYGFVLLWCYKEKNNYLKIKYLYIKNIPQRVAVYLLYYCIKSNLLSNLETHHCEVIVRIGTITMLLNLTLKCLNNLHGIGEMSLT